MDEEKSYKVSDLSPVLFWDVDRSKLSWDESERYIIERVAHLGALKDWLIIRKIYGDTRLKEVITTMRYLDEKSVIYYAEIFGIPLEKFRCYRLRQLGRIPFPF